ncbi:hypothetical protein GCM10011533_25090 [Streptosporangium jomthongense]|uniref:DUF2066 domain-containing protein n=1 Tax=Marinobacter aromaticivorans TaxID=1494078 RepID=A0ABW2IWD2_9GAMM|nr:DUF2066 domain-containing protein [Marinobacter aromaticivorans]GGE71725.1 hypothetical protein GCM10011533_25090 [Streptosporangium jomthongense]
MPGQDQITVIKLPQAFVLAVFCALILAVPVPVSAVTVSGLYSVEVPVSGSGPGDLAQGYADGLARVFVRISGTREVLAMDGVQALLADAESLLLSYQVLRGETGDSRLSMAFGAVGVNQALASIGAPVWGANRPLTLAWIAVEDRGVRRLIMGSAGSGSGNDDGGVWAEAFARAAQERGLPVALPPNEFSGNRELLSDIWGQFTGRVREASQGLEHDVLAMVRVSRSGGQWRAGWVFEGAKLNSSEESVTAATREALAEALVNRWAELYANRYAVAAGEVGDLPQVDIVLRGVTSVADYGKSSQVLEGLTPVVNVGASRVRGEQLTLRVAFSGELDQLREYIALDSRFVPAEGEPQGPSAPAQEVQNVTAGSAQAETAGPEVEPVPENQPDADKSKPSMFTYQPSPVDEEDAEQAFESLYQVLYYRWQPEPVIGNDSAR